jgi:hypothetical protein
MKRAVQSPLLETETERADMTRGSGTRTAAGFFKLHRQRGGKLLVYNFHGLLTWLLIRLRKERKGDVKRVAIKTVLKRVRGSAAALLLLQPSLLGLVIRTSPCVIVWPSIHRARLDAISPGTHLLDRQYAVPTPGLKQPP